MQSVPIHPVVGRVRRFDPGRSVGCVPAGQSLRSRPRGVRMSISRSAHFGVMASTALASRSFLPAPAPGSEPADRTTQSASRVHSGHWPNDYLCFYHYSRQAAALSESSQSVGAGTGGSGCRHPSGSPSPPPSWVWQAKPLANLHRAEDSCVHPVTWCKSANTPSSGSGCTYSPRWHGEVCHPEELPQAWANLARVRSAWIARLRSALLSPDRRFRGGEASPATCWGTPPEAGNSTGSCRGSADGRR
jgi:hypothetical protein